MKQIDNSETITAVDDHELPPEFKTFDKLLGREQHFWNWFYHSFLYTGFCYFVFYLVPFGHVPLGSFFLAFMCSELAGLGTTIGGHRYWTHKSFKAKLPLQVLLMLLQTATFQYPIFKWCRDHRVHHKYTDTDADPHNSKRGFWFSHMGWLYQPKHPEVEKKLKIVDISDLVKDPVVRFQSKYYFQLAAVMTFLLPISLCHWIFPSMSVIQLLAWNMAWQCGTLQSAFLVNSVAHIWGNKPYDKHITASDSSWIALIAIGEGWHNYHHTFPWDYKASELGWKLNLSTIFIDFFAYIGWAYDLKTVSHKLLVDRINRTGDGSHPLQNSEKHNMTSPEGNDDVSRLHWGWGDKELRKEDVEITRILFATGTD